jgi:integrase/recombinase XerD
MRWYRQKLDQLSRALKATDLAEVDREALLDFIGDLRDLKRSSAYVRGWYQVFRSFLGWCRKEGYEIHPSLVAERGDHWFTLKKPAATDPGVESYSEDEIDRILEAAATPRNRLFVRLLLGTGLRLSEALNLLVDDVEEDRLRVRSGKGRKPRMVPLNSRLQRDLHRYIERLRPDGRTDFVFLNRSGGQWTEWGVRSLCARLSKETGLRVHAHAFRHTFATNYLRAGGSVHTLQRILGHTTITMSLRYVHLTGADLAQDIDQLTM